MTDFRRMSIAEALDASKRDANLAMQLLGKPLDGAENAFALATGFPMVDMDIEKTGRRNRWARRKAVK